MRARALLLAMLICAEASAQPAVEPGAARGPLIDAATTVAANALNAGAPPLATVADAPREVFLEVFFQGQSIARLHRFLEQRGRLFASGRELRAIGLLTERLGIAAEQAEREQALDTFAEIQYQYDAARQTVDFDVPDHLRAPRVLNAYAAPQVGTTMGGRGMLVNYDALMQAGTGTRVGVWTEQRLFDERAGVFSHAGLLSAADGVLRYVRQDSFWRRDDPVSLQTLRIGDFIGAALSWTRGVRMGGVQWGSDFGLQPGLITFPAPTLTGSASVPSVAELYINHVRRLVQGVPNGPFVLRDVAGISGAGEATLVTRDGLGRTTTVTVPMYIDVRMLREGLSSYSLEAGWARRRYGEDSFGYYGAPAFSATWRRGLAELLTVEAHGEMTAGVHEFGAGVLLRLGMAGVIHAAHATNSGEPRGSRTVWGYQYLHPRVAVDLQMSRSRGSPADIASHDGALAPPSTRQFTVAVPLWARHSLSISEVAMQFADGSASRVGSLSWTAGLDRLSSLNLSIYRDFARADPPTILLTYNLSLDGRTAINTSLGRQGGAPSAGAGASRPPEYAGGWGWAAQLNRADGQHVARTEVQYLGGAGQLTAGAQQLGGEISAALGATGALAWMDGGVHVARRIDDGFALVSTEGTGEVAVLHDNRRIGVTGADGYLLIPDLNGYQSNRITIDSLKLPADAHIDKPVVDVVPRRRSGVLARFAVTHYVAATVILHDADGRPLPAGLRVVADGGGETVTGHDGETFVDGLRAENRLRVLLPKGECEVRFAYLRPSDGSLPTIGPLRCRRAEPAAAPTPDAGTGAAQ